ncbi:MAG: 2-phospho-L-lactate transferase [Acidimicrobiia bacterium]
MVLLSGGVGGARLGRGLAGLLGRALTVVVNVGDDDLIHGLEVSPDLDTVLYTLARWEGPHGWGVAGDSFQVMGHLAALGSDTSFRIGDRDLATNLRRTDLLRRGAPLSAVTARLAEALGVTARVLPATDDRLRTRVQTADGIWRSFQEYFVRRGHQDEVRDVRFPGASSAKPAPGVTEAIERAALVVVGPSNPPLSVWPILAVAGVGEALVRAPRLVGVSPLVGGKAVKGPADRVLRSLGFPAGNAGVIAAYDGLLHELWIDESDRAEQAALEELGCRIRVAPTRIADPGDAEALAARLLAQGDAQGDN